LIVHIVVAQHPAFRLRSMTGCWFGSDWFFLIEFLIEFLIGFLIYFIDAVE